MDVMKLIEAVITFLQTNTIIAAIIGLFLLYLLIRETKIFFGLLVLVVLLLGVLLMIQLIGGEGGYEKSRMIKEGPLPENAGEGR